MVCDLFWADEAEKVAAMINQLTEETAHRRIRRRDILTSLNFAHVHSLVCREPRDSTDIAN